MPRLKLKRSDVTGLVPSAAELELGELALNTFDGKLFTKISQSGQESVITIGGDASTTGVLFVSKNGDDANSGTAANAAKQTIKSAIEVAEANVFTPVNVPPSGYYDAIALLKLNRTFIQKEVVAFIGDIFPVLTFNQDKCERDVGLIVDAVIVDLEFGGNEESVYAARSYLSYTGTLIEGQVNATATAVGYAKTLSRQIIRNVLLGFTYQTEVVQQADPSYVNGIDANARIIELFDIIEDTITGGEDAIPVIIENAVNVTPYTIRVASGDYTEDNPIQLPPFTAIVGDSLRTVTVRPSNSDQDLFHVTHGDYLSDMTFSDHVAPTAAVAFNPAGNTFLQRSVESWRSPYIQNCTSKTTTGTGMRVDGSVAGGLRSMVVDSYTQYNEGGIGVHLLNRGYAQLVSVFTICCQDAFLAESGGFCSITNSNSSFGTYGLRATGVSESLYQGSSAGVDQSGTTITIDGLITRPNIGDAVKFVGDDFYYTVTDSTSLFTTVNTGGYTEAGDLLILNKDYIADKVGDYVDSTYPTLNYDRATCERDVALIVEAIGQDLKDGGVENSDEAADAYWAATQSRVAGQIDETADAVATISAFANQVLSGTAIGMVTDPNLTPEAGAGTVVTSLVGDIAQAITREVTGSSDVTLEQAVLNVVADNTVVTFHQRSLIGASAHTFEYVGSGNQIEYAVPYLGGRPIQENEVVEDDNGAGKVNFTSTDQNGDFRIGQELVIERATGTISGRTFNRSLFAVMTPYILAITE